MSKKLNGLNQNGFTLIELISVLIIMGVVASVSIQRFDVLGDSTSQRVLYTGIKELNIRESLLWSNSKISLDGYTNDEDIFSALNTNLGQGFEWTPDPPGRESGGTLKFKTASKVLTRQVSTQASAGKWE